MSVYFIQSGPNGPIKIGFTNDSAKSRLRVMQTGNPMRLRLLLQIEGDERLEAGLHQHFSDSRVRGEWFHPVSSLLELIEANRPKPVVEKNEDQDQPSESFQAYLAIHGNASRLADALGITKGAVAQWSDVPIKRVPDVERITGIDRSKLRPDFFPPSKADAA
jgi:hypothetical protein